MKVRADPYARLSDEKASVRIDAAISLIQDIHKCHARDEEEASKSKQAVQLTSHGLTIHLDYVLNRLISGLESTDRFATIGFSTALSMVLEHFDQELIPNLALEAIIMKAYQQTYGAFTHAEKQAFDLGCLYLIQTFHRVNRLNALSADVVEVLLDGIARLFKQYSQMGEICVETVSSLCESLYKSSSQHYQSILNTLTGFIPGTPTSIKPHSNKVNTSLPEQLQQWNACSIIAALSLRRIGQSAVYSTQFPGFFEKHETWNFIYTILSPSFVEYPAVHSAWTHLLIDSLHIPGQFKMFWDSIIALQLSQAFSYHRKGTAMGIIVSVLNKIMFMTQTAIKAGQPEPFSATTLQMVLSTVFSSPQLVNVIMMHSRANDTPLYLQSVTVLHTLEQMCTVFPPLITFIIATFQNPTKGGSRSFDTKSNTKFIYNLSQLLTTTDLISYISSTIDGFHKAEEIITQDIKHIALLEKQRQESNIAMVDQQEAEISGQQATSASDNKKGNKKVKKGDDKKITNVEDDSSILNTDFSVVKDIDTFMISEMAKSAISRGTASFQSWTVDHVYHLCELLFKLQRAAQYQLTQQSKLTHEEKPTKKSKKATKTSAPAVMVDAVQLEQTLQKCIKFLYSHAFFKPNATDVVAAAPAQKGKKSTIEVVPATTTIVQCITPTCQELFKERFISLYSTLHDNDSHYFQHSPTSLYFGTNESRWGSFVHELDVELRTVSNCIPMISNSDSNKNAIENAAQTLQGVDAFIQLLQPMYEKDRTSEAKQYIDFATMIKYLTTTCYALFYSDSSILCSTLSDLKIIFHHIQKDFFANNKKAGKPITLSPVELALVDDEEAWVDVLLDLLLSILGLGHSLTRSVVLHSFKLLVPHLTMSSIQLLVDPIAQAVLEEEEQGENGKKDGNMNDDDEPDDFLDFDEDGEQSDLEDGEDFSSLIKEFNSMDESDSDNDDEDDEDSDVEQLGAIGATDILLDNPNMYLTKDQEDAIAGIVRIHKEKRNAQKNKLQAQMVMKLRILDLLEVLMEELHGSNAWLSLLLPMIILIKSSRSSQVAALHQRAITLFKNKLTHVSLQNRAVASKRSELKLNESDPLYKFIAIDQNASIEDIITPQQMCHGDSLQSILEAIFDSMNTQDTQKQPQSEESGMNRSAMAGHALAAVANFYLMAPAGAEEMNTVNPKAKKAIRGKKASTISSPSTSTMSTEEMQKAIFENRTQYFIKSFLPMVRAQYASKKEQFTPAFFESIFNVPAVSGAYMWIVVGESGDVSVINVLTKAMINASSSFLRKQAGELLITCLKYFKHAINNNVDKYQQVYNNISSVYTTTAQQIQTSASQIETLQQVPQKGKNSQLVPKLKAQLKLCRTVWERSSAVVQLLEDKLNITESILSNTKKNKQTKPTKSTKPTTPAKKADQVAATPAKKADPVAATPAKKADPVATTPAKKADPVAATPAKKAAQVAATPAKKADPVAATPAKKADPVATTPAKKADPVATTPAKKVAQAIVHEVLEPVTKSRKSTPKNTIAEVEEQQIVEIDSMCAPATPRRSRKPADLSISIDEDQEQNIPEPRRSPRRTTAATMNDEEELAQVSTAPRRGRRAAAATPIVPDDVPVEPTITTRSKRRATTQQPADNDVSAEEAPLLRRSSRRRD